MSTKQRVTLTLPSDLVRALDRLGNNRSEVVLQALRRELERRRRQALAQSLENPHPGSTLLAEEGLQEWGARLPDEDASSLVDLAAGTPVRWVPGRGWVEDRK